MQAEEPADSHASGQAQSFERAFVAHDGGLTARDVGRRAEMTSPDVNARADERAAAEARVAQAVAGFLPRISLSARFARLSEIPPDVVGNVVGTLQPGPVAITCPPPASAPAGQPVSCSLAGRSVPLAFSSIPHQYSVQGSLTVPLSDYVLRLSQNYASASHAEIFRQDRDVLEVVQANASMSHDVVRASASTSHEPTVEADMVGLAARRIMRMAGSGKWDGRAALEKTRRIIETRRMNAPPIGGWRRMDAPPIGGR